MNTRARLSTGMLLLCLVAILAPSALAADAPATPSPDQLAFFEQKIRPLLVDQCYACHSADAKANKKLKGSLFLDSREGLLKGGDTGPAILPGQSAKSLLMKAVRWEDPDVSMPPKKKLPDAAIADLAKWIDTGAADPRTGGPVVAGRKIDLDKGREHWSFRPLAPVTPPAVKNTAWPRTAVDPFILAQLEAASLTPSAPISREKLARRAYFDLVGLPPTPEELAAFLSDASPDAYAKLIDRLLASPRYGERWGRHWLDVVRYAESGGYEFDNFRPAAYHYRDWVIRALNADMPYDQFVRMQLAGDKMMPGHYDGAAATGFLVAGPYPGQITAKTRERIRYDQLDDMVATIGESMLGATLGCVRCHDHKYDPFPQQDYYGIAAALARTEQGDVKIDRDHEENQRKLTAHEAALAPLKAALAKYEAEQLPAQVEQWRRDALPKYRPTGAWQSLDPVSAEATTAKLSVGSDGLIRYESNKVKDDTYTIKIVTFQTGVSEIRIDALADKFAPAGGPGLSDNGNFVLADVKLIAKPLDPKSKIKPVTLKLSPGRATFEQKDYPLKNAVDDNPTTGWAVAPQMGKDHAATFLIDGQTTGFPGGTEFEFQLKFTGHFGLGRMRLSFSNGEGPTALTDPVEPQHARELRAILTPVSELDGAINPLARPHLARFLTPFDPRVAPLLAAVRDHQHNRPKPALIDVYSTKAGGEDVYLLKRGEVDNKAGKAPPSFIQVLARADAKRWTAPAAVASADASTALASTAAKTPLPAAAPPVDPRVALANWMTDHDAGAGDLLARVIVNRAWKHHFGQGLVRSPNDFGTRGERPTHPELLDFLANELIRNNWQLKPLHRLIMLSAAYQQGVADNPPADQRDPENKLWWHRPARRLEAEAVRDALLLVGGKLDDKMFGPSEAAVESPRRSVYLRVKRSELVPFLTLFDGPEPTGSIGDRGVTTVPTQALTLMNSPFVRDAAARLAKRAATGAATPAAAIDNAFHLALARAPSAMERTRFEAYRAAQVALLTKPKETPTAATLDKALAQTCLVLLCTNEFVYVD